MLAFHFMPQSLCGTKEGSSIVCSTIVSPVGRTNDVKLHNPSTSSQVLVCLSLSIAKSWARQSKAMSTSAGSATVPGHSSQSVLKPTVAAPVRTSVPVACPPPTHPADPGAGINLCHTHHGGCSCLARPPQAGPDQTHPRVHLRDELGWQRREEGFGKDTVTSQPQRD